MLLQVISLNLSSPVILIILCLIKSNLSNNNERIILMYISYLYGLTLTNYRD